MPVASIPLETINRTILEKTYFSIVKDIVDTIKIPSSTITIMHRDIEVTRTDTSTNVSNLESKNTPTTSSKRRVIVDITEDYNEEELTSSITHQQEAFPIFRDHTANVTIYPIYVKSDINIEVTYVTPSQSELIRVRDDIRIRLGQTRNIQVHDIDYDIMLPTVVEDFIADVYDLRSRLQSISLEEYFREYSTKRVRLITDMGNEDNSRISIYEKQIRVPGLFDFNSMPDKMEIDNENGNYKLTFTYKLSLDVPKALVMRYPVMVCNRPLPSKYLQFIEDNKINSKEELNRNNNYTFYSLYSLSHFEAHRQLENRVDIKLPMNVPLFDDFNVKQGHKGYSILVSFLTDIDETDNRTLFNLYDIDPYYIDSNVLNFVIAGEKDFMVNPYMSFLFLGLYQDERHFDNSVLEILSDGTVRSKVDLDLCRQTRVTLSIIIDLSMLSEEAIDRLISNTEILAIFILEYITAYRNNKTLVKDSKADDIYRTLLKLVYRLYLLEDIDGLKGIFSSISVDEHIFTSFTSLLYNNYRLILNFLVDNNVLVETDINTNRYINYIDSDTESMKTVMTNHIVALRIEE
jgi:hypothetical protein